MIYQIKFQGTLDKSWSDWLGEVELHSEPADTGGPLTLLSVELVDQAALYGVLDRLRDLNLKLISVTQQN